MRIAAAPNAFRGSLSAFQAAVCILEGLQQSRLPSDVLLMPLADGGDGTLDVVMRAVGGERLTIPVLAADGRPVEAQLGLLPDGQTALIEMAQASGVESTPVEHRNPLLTSTYGTGQLIQAALERGFHRLIIGLGGSATNDGGAGCMEALGARLLDSDGRSIPRGGAGLARLARIDATALKSKFQDVEVAVLCDVENPLLGPDGASAVFAPQKGADAHMIETLEAALTRYAEIVRRDLGLDVAAIPGGGAAGGFGAGLIAFLNGKLAPGAQMLMALVGYDQQLDDVELVITGEGRLDRQTAGGKAVQAIANLALQREIPVAALVGTLDCEPADLRAMNIDVAWSIVPGPCSLDEARAHAAEWLTRAATEFGNSLALGRLR